jgi:hypothetical protein
MKLYQLADDVGTYGENAGWWMIVSDDGDTELAGPFKHRTEAEKWISDNPSSPLSPSQSAGDK